MARGIDPLMRRFVELADEKGKSLGQIGEDAGLSYRTMYSWNLGSIPNVSSFNAALNVLGYKLEIVPL